MDGIEALMTKGSSRLRDVLAQGVVTMTDHLRARLSDGSLATAGDVDALAIDPAITQKLRGDIEAVLLSAHDDARDHARESILRRRNAAVDAMVDRLTARAVARDRRSARGEVECRPCEAWQCCPAPSQATRS